MTNGQPDTYFAISLTYKFSEDFERSSPIRVKKKKEQTFLFLACTFSPFQSESAFESAFVSDAQGVKRVVVYFGKRTLNKLHLFSVVASPVYCVLVSIPVFMTL